VTGVQTCALPIFKGEIQSDLQEAKVSTAEETFRQHYLNEPLPVRTREARIPKEDMAILGKAADDYKLHGDARYLLFAIYIAENGGSGREMGVLNPEAMRYKGDHAKSLELQAQWAAGTIAKRFDGDLEAFAQRWCPLNADNDPTGLNAYWLPNVQKIMAEMNG
jgi:hypothetical protein